MDDVIDCDYLRSNMMLVKLILNNVAVGMIFGQMFFFGYAHATIY